MPPLIIVPEGVDARGQPTFVFCAVLDYAREHYNDGRELMLAPANRFDSEVYEQQAAKAYLHDWRGNVVCPPTPSGAGYIDTRGNAKLLRQYRKMEGMPPAPPSVLIAGHLHIRRAVLCFRREGFDIVESFGVPYPRPPSSANFPRRLWYYRRPLAHLIYETMATARDITRPARQENKP